MSHNDHCFADSCCVPFGCTGKVANLIARIGDSLIEIEGFELLPDRAETQALLSHLEALAKRLEKQVAERDAYAALSFQGKV